MHSVTVAQQVRKFVIENYILSPDYRFEDNDSFLEHGIIDSTGVLQLVAFLEETYNITIEDEELIPQNLDSVEAVSAYVSRKLNGAADAGFAIVQSSVVQGAA